jgi:hypothetical protein
MGLVALRIEHLPFLSIPGDAFASQIGQVRAERGALAPVSDDAGLDDDAARSIVEQTRGRNARNPAASEGAVSAS